MSLFKAITQTDKELTDKLICQAAHMIGVEKEQLFSKSRVAELVLGRNMVLTKLRTMGYSHKQIERLTGRNHATVIHDIRRFNTDIELYGNISLIYNEFLRCTDEIQ